MKWENKARIMQFWWDFPKFPGDCIQLGLFVRDEMPMTVMFTFSKTEHSSTPPFTSVTLALNQHLPVMLLRIEVSPMRLALGRPEKIEREPREQCS